MIFPVDITIGQNTLFLSTLYRNAWTQVEGYQKNEGGV